MTVEGMEASRKVWDQIGRVILGRGQDVTDSSITNRDGMTADDIIAMANKRRQEMHEEFYGF